MTIMTLFSIKGVMNNSSWASLVYL